MPTIKKNNDKYNAPVIVVTAHDGVLFGYMNEADTHERSFPLMKTKVAIDWGTTHGINQLANTGPTVNSLISAEADAPIVHDAIKILSVTREAEAAWLKA